MTFRYERFAVSKEWRLFLVGITLLVQRSLVVSGLYVLLKKLIQDGFPKMRYRPRSAKQVRIPTQALSL